MKIGVLSLMKKDTGEHARYIGGRLPPGVQAKELRIVKIVGREKQKKEGEDEPRCLTE